MSAFPRLSLLLGLGLALPLLANAANPLDDEVRAAARAVMAVQDIPGLAVGVTAPGLRRLYYFGTADRRSGQPVDAATLFEIGSLSKTYTATLGGYSAVTGRLRLDESAAQVRPALAGSAIGQASLLQLATYSAGGLPLQFPDSVTTDDQATAFYRAFQPPFPAGSRRLYANPSIGLFGALAAQRLDEPFATALLRHVLKPLGLDHTYLQVPAARTISRCGSIRVSMPKRPMASRPPPAICSPSSRRISIPVGCRAPWPRRSTPPSRATIAVVP